ncbi:MAG: GatB/YqeY domain-containing protein [Bacteroidetes bacterium]|nr:MAG: GatB/YqeY domain-containing protein [Bacteroidota bacterium]
MSLETAVMDLMKTAMKAKDDAALRGARAIKAAIIVAKTSAGAGGVLKPEDEVKLLQKLVKQRKDSLEIYEAQGRQDLAATERDEISVISRFLPQQLEGADLEAAIKAIIAEAGATSAADMGKVMGAANKQLAGKADGKSISAVVKTLLAS